MRLRIPQRVGSVPDMTTRDAQIEETESQLQAKLATAGYADAHSLNTYDLAYYLVDEGADASSWTDADALHDHLVNYFGEA
jgi:hypothetical protein